MATTRLSKPCPECGTSLHIEATKCKCGWQDARAAAKASHVARHACSAYGCCLPGTIYSGVQSKDGWCYVHDGHRETLPIQGLTTAINLRQGLFDGMYAIVKEVGLVEWWKTLPGRYARPFREAGREDLLPTPAERHKTITGWAARVRRELEADILRDLGVDVKSGAKPPAPRTYAPTDDDFDAAHQAQLAIDSGAWKKPDGLIGGVQA